MKKMNERGSHITAIRIYLQDTEIKKEYAPLRGISLLNDR
jgi:hypothetical protein